MESYDKPFGNYEGLEISDDLHFLIDYVQEAGNYAVSQQTSAVGERKSDRTLVTGTDKMNHRTLQQRTRRKWGSTAAIHGEEGKHLKPGEHALLVCADELDGTEEYGATHRDPVIGQLIKLGEPLPPGAVEIKDSERSSCVVAGVFRHGFLTSVAMYNPFTDELLVADGEMGGTFLNGHRIDLRTNPAVQEATFGEGMPYDFASWHGSLLDPRHLRRDLATEPNGTFAASGQIRDVLKLDSMSCVFTGTTIHDMLLGLAVELAGGVVTGLDGNPIDWDNPNGAVYSVNQNVHDGMIAALTADRLDGLAPGYEPVGKDDVTAEEILALRREAGFGTSWDEAALRSWRATLEKAEAFYGARERATGRLVLASLITGSPQVGFIHDILTAKDHRRFGLASRAVDKLVAYARNYVVDGEPVGMKDVYTDLGIRDLGRVPLEDCFKANQFEPDGENGYVWKLNLRKRNLTPAA